MLQPGKLISSRNTFFLKRILPVLWLAALGLPLLIVLTSRGRAHPVPPLVLVGPVLLCVLGYFLMRKLVFDLADAVYDEGDSLRVRFGTQVERIPLADIVNVSYAGMTNPQRITLTVRVPGHNGREIVFSPSQTFWPPLLRPNPLVNELIERVDAARRR